MNKILYTTHIMWWHSKLMPDILDSLESAINNTNENLKIDLLFLLNEQTYLEEPISGNPKEMFSEFLNHSIMKNSKIIYKTNHDDFYNVIDFERDTYNLSYDYTVWGHPDCLVPKNFFLALEKIINMNLPIPHVIATSRQKMWDDSWKHVEHFFIRNKSIDELSNDELGKKMIYRYPITLSELNEINEKFENQLSIFRAIPPKCDAALITISKNMPIPFLHKDLHLKRDDTFLMLFLELNNIPLYIIDGMISGHILHHPKKQTNMRSKNNSKLLHELLEKKFQFLCEATKLEYATKNIFKENKL